MKGKGEKEEYVEEGGESAQEAWVGRGQTEGKEDERKRKKEG